MDKNCFVKRYKVSVSDENLPALETMQQFTLDAITASGNSAMTDAQKWALNHFFYELGVFSVDTNTIWNKLESVVMPILATDVNHCSIDYKDNHAYGYSAHKQYIGFSNNGIYSTHTSAVCAFKKTITNVDIKNIAIVQLNAGHTKYNANIVDIITSENMYSEYDISLSKGVVSDTQLVGIVSNVNYGYRCRSAKPSDLVAISLNGVNGTTADNSSLYVIDDSTIVNYPLDVYKFNNFTAESATLLNMVTTSEAMNPLHLTIVGKNLNSADTLKLAKAVYDFREAYLG